MKKPPVDLWRFEREALQYNYTIIAGIDEAGRGPLCGPVCAAAVILPFETDIPGLNDSKKLTEKKREELFPVIESAAVSYGIAFASPEEIDKLNILNATFLAMRRAVDKLTVRPQMLFVDGNRISGQEIEAKLIVKGDSLSASIAAASVLAKVTRDRYMDELDAEFPMYNLKQHKGYPTEEHYRLLAEYGAAPFYRKSFLKNIDRAAVKRKNGIIGEDAAAADYTNDGYEILFRDRRFGKAEVDIIARKGNTLVFSEVKTRSQSSFGRPADAVTAAQQDRIIEAAFLCRSAEFPDCTLRFDIVEVNLDNTGAVSMLKRLEGGFR